MPVFVVVIVLLLVISIAWTSIVGAPWVPSSMKVVHRMLRLAQVGPDDVVYDLGCGDGRTIIAAARHYGARAVGIEIDPLRYLWCQLLITLLGLRQQVKVVYGNFFIQDFSEATVVTCYLGQYTNLKLETVLKQKLRSGSRVVTNTFPLLSFEELSRDGDVRLYLL